MTENAKLIHTMYAAFGRGDIQFILSHLADDVEWICPGPASVPFTGSYRSPAEVAKFFAALGTTQTGQNLKVENTYSDGDAVITNGHYASTVTATGKFTDTWYAHFFTVKDGKVTRFLDLIDTAAAADSYSAAAAHTVA